MSHFQDWARRSGRTPERPWALSASEVVRGALVAYGLFILIGPYASSYIVMASGGIFFAALVLALFGAVSWGLVMCVTVGGIALVVLGIPLALAIERIVHGSTSRLLHQLSAVILGTIVGAATWIVCSALTGEFPTAAPQIAPSFWFQLVGMSALTGLVSWLGWRMTMRTAVNDDLRSNQQERTAA